MDEFCHYYPAKLVIFNDDKEKVLLAKRSGEDEYDGVWNYPGGRKERQDKTILDGLRREKHEELGDDIEIDVYPEYAHTTSFTRSDDIPVIVACYPAIHRGGHVNLNEDYSDASWFSTDDIASLEPTTPGMHDEIQRCKELLRLDTEPHRI